MNITVNKKIAKILCKYTLAKVSIATILAATTIGCATKEETPRHVELDSDTIVYTKPEIPQEDYSVVQEVKEEKEVFMLNRYIEDKSSELFSYRSNEITYNADISNAISNIKYSFCEAIENSSSKEMVDDFFTRGCENVDYNLVLNDELKAKNVEYFNANGEKLMELASKFQDFNYEEYMKMMDEEQRVYWSEGVDSGNYTYFLSEVAKGAYEKEDLDHDGYYISVILSRPEYNCNNDCNLLIASYEGCNVNFHLMTENERKFAGNIEIDTISIEQINNIGIYPNAMVK